MKAKVVVDSDSIFAIYNPNDPLNKKAIKTFHTLIAQEYQLIYPSSVIFEVISLFQRVLPNPKVTKGLIEMVINGNLTIYIIDYEILKEAAKLFNPSGSRKNTLIDCSVAVVAKKLRADGVFSYDNYYSKQGLKLAEDLTEN